MHIAVTDRRRGEAHSHFACVRLVDLDVLDDQRLAELVADGRLHSSPRLSGVGCRLSARTEGPSPATARAACMRSMSLATVRLAAKSTSASRTLRIGTMNIA